MIRKVLYFILSALLILSILSLGACRLKDEKTHEEILSEMNEKGKAYNEKRKKFLSSDVYAEAHAYVLDTLEGFLPGCRAEISLEPGSLIDSDLSEFADFSENKETRLSFFSQARLYISVNFWDFNVDADEFCKQLMSYQISGEMSADEYDHDSYRLDAVTGEFSYYIMPGV